MFWEMLSFPIRNSFRSRWGLVLIIIKFYYHLYLFLALVLLTIVLILTTSIAFLDERIALFSDQPNLWWDSLYSWPCIYVQWKWHIKTTVHVQCICTMEMTHQNYSSCTMYMYNWNDTSKLQSHVQWKWHVLYIITIQHIWNDIALFKLLYIFRTDVLTASNTTSSLTILSKDDLYYSSNGQLSDKITVWLAICIARTICTCISWILVIWSLSVDRLEGKIYNSN